jgi:hypothetical protein
MNWRHYILLPIAAVAKAIMDCAQIGALNWGAFWNEQESWRNKWADGLPANGEAFPGSSTVFVSLTSGWHLMQMVVLTCFFVAIVSYEEYQAKVTASGVGGFKRNKLIDFAAMSIGFRIIFELTYRYLKG